MIYFDNGATTPLCAGAIERMREAVGLFGNPSSAHLAGRRAEELEERARSAILKALNAPKEKYSLIFTSGGTEGNNLAVFGTAYAKKHRNPKILVTDSEHPCILEPCKRLEGEGFRVARIPTRGGAIDEEAFFAEMDGDVILVSFMTVNNETGAVYDVRPLFEAAKRINPRVLCHTDGVQAFLKIPFTAKSAGADMITVSAHKVHGPKGCGALIVSNDVLRRKALLPRLVGGGQEGGLRSGTENTIGIAGFYGAVEERSARFEEDAKRMEELRAYVLARLPDGVTANIPERHAPHILSVTLPHIKSETMLNYLSERGICVSAGSACANKLLTQAVSSSPPL